MASNVHTTDIDVAKPGTVGSAAKARFGVPGTVLLVLGAVGLIAALLGRDYNLFFQSYMFGWIFWLMLALGCLGVQITANMIRPTWAMAILRVCEAGASTIPVLMVMGLPILWAAWAQDTVHLFHWGNADALNDPILQHKLPYLNKPFITFRYFLFFGIWSYYWWYFAKSKKGTLAQDKSFDNRIGQDRVNVASPGLVVYIITITFFFTDWVMALDPHWFSTLYGAWWAMIAVGAAIAFGTVFITMYHRHRPYTEIVNNLLTKDLGNMMFAFTMLWGYFSVSQVLIYWSGNLPEYVSFYYDRFKGPMAYLGGAIVVLQFFTPFLLLLSGKLKRTPRWLGNVAAVILTARILDVWYQIEPFFKRELTDIFAIAVDFAAWAFVGGIFLGLFVTEFKKHSEIILHDTRLQELTADPHH